MSIASMTDDQAPVHKMRGASAKLRDVLNELKSAAPETEPGRATARIGDVIDKLDERAFGFLMLLLVLPCCLPFVYVLPQIVSVPMAALALQMAAGGRHPWLPKKLHDRRFSIAAFEGVLDKAEKYGGWIERIATPRFRPVTGHLAHRFIGVLLFVPIISILTPFPLTNTVPGVGVALAALGLIERDGLLVIGGLLLGFVWVFLLLFVGAEAVQFAKDWLLQRF